MKSPQSPSSDSSAGSPPQKKPLWETLVIAGSFAGVWIYFLAWLAAGRANAPLSVWWQFLLIPCVFALVVVFRRRLARARDAVRESASPRPPRF